MAKKLLPEGILDETFTLNLQEFCYFCRVEESYIIEMVEIGILEPQGEKRSTWEFTIFQLQRFKKAERLLHDLKLNLPGAALGLELLDRLRSLQSRIKSLEHQIKLVSKD